jgi:hypothetical protein
LLKDIGSFCASRNLQENRSLALASDETNLQVGFIYSVSYIIYIHILLIFIYILRGLHSKQAIKRRKEINIIMTSVVGIDLGYQNSLIAAAGRGGVDVLLNGNSQRLNPYVRVCVCVCAGWMHGLPDGRIIVNDTWVQ